MRGRGASGVGAKMTAAAKRATTKKSGSLRFPTMGGM